MENEQQSQDAPLNPEGEKIHLYALGKMEEKQNTQQFLVKDGRIVFCHKLPPSMDMPKIQAIQAQVKVIPMPCSLDCGKANVYKMPDGSFEYEQACDIAIIRFRLHQAEQQAADDNTTKKADNMKAVK